MAEISEYRRNKGCGQGMPAGAVLEYSNYREYKAQMDRAMLGATEQFVVIGYLLKVARDTDILRESGYRTMAEFAKAEYRIDPGTASKFIGINDRFSEGGYSMRLAEHYRGIGQSILADMLALPEAVNEEITKEFSREDVRTLKGEVREEEKITDLEVLMEERDAQQEELEGLDKVVYQMGRDFPQLYRDIFGDFIDTIHATADFRNFKELLAPDEEKIWSVRVPGTGKILVSVKAKEENVSWIYVRTGEKDSCAWTGFREAWGRRMHYAQLDGRASWEEEYGEAFPEGQQEPERKMPEAKAPEKKAPKVERPKAPEKKAPKVERPKAPEKKAPKVERSKAPEKKAPEAETKKTEIAPAQTAAPTETGNRTPCSGIPPELASREAEVTGNREPGVQIGAGKPPAAGPSAEGPEGQIPGQDSIELHPEWMPTAEGAAGFPERQQEPESQIAPAQKQKVHQVRIDKKYFDDVAAGIKTFELRKNDRGYQAGDGLTMSAFEDGRYTGREIRADIVYMLENYAGLESGYCILGIKVREVS